MTHLPHHVVLRNGCEDVVCACGEHFRSTVRDLGLGQGQAGLDAIQQWVAHYKAEQAADVAREEAYEAGRQQGLRADALITRYRAIFGQDALGANWDRVAARWLGA